MIILPAIDLVGGKCVRLQRGDYARMTVYSDDPAGKARSFEEEGARWLHVVDLEGARDGGTPNIGAVKKIIGSCGLRIEIGGGIRDMDTVRRYMDAGARRVILGTAAVEDRVFLREALRAFGSAVAVGIDMRDGFAAVKGWTETTQVKGEDFAREMEGEGVRTLIVTDISRDGAMRGTNRALYERLAASCGAQVVASGGVSTLEDVSALRDAGAFGAIIGKALYTGGISLRQAIGVAK